MFNRSCVMSDLRLDELAGDAGELIASERRKMFQLCRRIVKKAARENECLSAEIKTLQTELAELRNRNVTSLPTRSTNNAA